MKLITFLYTYVANLHRDTKGASAIEYAIIAGLVAIGFIVIAGTLGTNIGEVFTSITTSLQGIDGVNAP
ncbi:Flp family type IVb pilin [Halomonas sp. SpR8]|uniref:Flp family type IVb pilin n=1 Tax=Halomonas sp. SpR8 TaxID=3050463 RepID=UPI0027E4C457|nr:Flp family type IVb pilin [Halomonas sp. SpR8]MDQ7728167.1 Flp family type IVb pilin [Halomonas sp. SpR8]